ncbi:MAG: UDP-N-acetylglucosamine 2-epimerase (non-hydrolyzing) [Acidobacteriota bacterium]|nr:UDP-N-acetylglucosamine 2-epimerase (non-hydrolyzing) [Acidobacteriota bacterium]
MRVVSVVGARPQFIKVAAVAKALEAHDHVVVHTGQHYDANMSAVFFDELALPKPDFDLAIGSGPHGAQTGAMLAALEPIFVSAAPDWVLVYGDTNSTLAGALAAVKLNLPVAHIEAGLRSFNRRMPEEINRVVADHVSDLLFCPSAVAVAHLRAEGITKGVHEVGDVMADALAPLSARARERSTILSRLRLTPANYLLATLHRAENTDDAVRLTDIVGALNALEEPVVLPLHPRTKGCLDRIDARLESHIAVIDPLGYLDMLQLTQHARLVLTDSGGLQKEAYWLGIPCVTLRDETEWVETVDAGWNILVGADRERIIRAATSFAPPALHPPLYGGGQASERIVRILCQ